MTGFDEWLRRPSGLAHQLRSLRLRADFTGAALAETLGWIQPKVSKIETGRQMPSAADVEAWARACNADDDMVASLLELRTDSEAYHRRWRQASSNLASIQDEYDRLVREATVIRNVEVTTIPGLLQTPGYARHQAMQAVSLHDADPADVDAAVSARMRRQEVLYDEAKTFEFVITEAALRNVYCPREAMLAQLDRLLGVAVPRSNLWFGILPQGVELSVVAQNRFLMLDDLVIVEDYADEVRYRGERAATYTKAMELLKAEAYTDDQARQLIVWAIDDLRQREKGS